MGDVQQGVVAYLDQSEVKAVEAFAVARAINATISVLKSTDLSAVFAQIAPMEVLEPIDDLAKQFSDVMVVSIISIFIQRLILTVSQAWAFGYVLPAGCLLLAASHLRFGTGEMAARLAMLGRSIVVMALFARCVVLASGWVGESITTQFLADDLNASLVVVHTAGGSSEQLQERLASTEPSMPPPADTAPAPANAAPPATFWGLLAGAAQRAANKAVAAAQSGSAMLESTKAWLPDKQAISDLLFKLPGHIVRVIEIFLVQTLVTPLCVAAFFYVAVRGAVRPMPLPNRIFERRAPRDLQPVA
jgi:hypothetical protein